MTTDIAQITDLQAYKTIGLNLSATYWSPANVGDTKRLLFMEIKSIQHPNEETAEAKELPTAVFVDPATKEVIHQGSARLVAIFQRENTKPLTPVQITYRGKVKNSTNQFSSDAWEVYYLAKTDKG